MMMLTRKYKYQIESIEILKGGRRDNIKSERKSHANRKRKKQKWVKMQEREKRKHTHEAQESCSKSVQPYSMYRAGTAL